MRRRTPLCSIIGWSSCRRWRSRVWTSELSDSAARALGRKVAFHRTQRGLSQRDFAAMIDRSETWVSQVERGVRRIDRMTVLRRVAEALDVPVSELAAETAVV